MHSAWVGVVSRPVCADGSLLGLPKLVRVHVAIHGLHGTVAEFVLKFSELGGYLAHLLNPETSTMRYGYSAYRMSRP
jgi:hypothetical protein